MHKWGVFFAIWYGLNMFFVIGSLAFKIVLLFSPPLSLNCRLLMPSYLSHPLSFLLPLRFPASVLPSPAIVTMAFPLVTSFRIRFDSSCLILHHARIHQNEILFLFFLVLCYFFIPFLESQNVDPHSINSHWPRVNSRSQKKKDFPRLPPKRV